MGALYLKPLDDLMERLDLPYVRYMDDWVILAKTRWALRRVVQQVNTILDHLKLEKHPDKRSLVELTAGSTFWGTGLWRKACVWPPRPSSGLSSEPPGFTSKVRQPAASGSTFGIG